MVTTRSRTGNSSTKKSGAATSSKAKSGAGRAAAQLKRATRSKKSQPTSTKETQQSKIGKNWKWQHSAEKKLPKKDWSKETDIEVLRAKVIELEAIVLERNQMIKYMEKDNQRYDAGYRPWEEWYGDEEDCPPDSDDWSD
ncbi:hypothetical protein A1Q1_05921 [Trichosporon asahii var. asahii CBS 2479]|uniref:Uncharacterized protein n=1 Tax=Trichosporon asahii var. asahii (strain ATCC 90039 / CBS 2479 / JCM 2466 / KCTC 7840 / NBRC 103889/ NCYC 2677 / UAMH 7654) TaxID=1186058 RepID=J6ESP8_TRIAS|nr:hypothetical protein A1Q1_05921 [Trichosporon asahii var. asahii CBS 2479]EJT45772.1 hypothetical protein A1Q1_05921 [Trichosporon asahii var. asahii CBS 2479]